MDYPGWELERQRRALRALLLGGGEGRENGEALEESQRRPEEREAAGKPAAGRDGRSAREEDAAGPGNESVREGRAAVRRASRDRREEGAGVRVLEAGAGILERAAGGPAPLRGLARGEETAPRAEGSAAPGEAEAAGPEGGGPAEEAAERLRPRARPAQSPGGGTSAGINAAVMGPARGGTAWVSERRARSGPWGEAASAALRAEDEAAALSRAVQRDARRYDGGFTIY